MTRSLHWYEVTRTKSALEEAVSALEEVIRLGVAPPSRGATFIEKERLLREVAFCKSKYIVAVDQFNGEYPAAPGQPDRRIQKDTVLLGRTTAFDEGYLSETPIDNGRELPKIAEPGKALKNDDIKDKHGNRRSARDTEAARLLTQHAFKKFHLHEIDRLIRRGEPLDEEFMSGFLQSERNLAIISKRSPVADPHEVKAINRAIWTEFLTLYQQRTDDLLTQELNYRFFGHGRPVNGVLPVPHVDPNAPIIMGGAVTITQAMLTALGLPNAAPNLPTFAQFKAAMIALQPNTPQWDNFWNTVPTEDPIDQAHPNDPRRHNNRSALQGLVKSHQMVSIDNTNLLADTKAWNSKLETKHATAYEHSISGYEHILDHNAAMAGVTPEATIAIAPSVTALALAEEAAKRGPINPDTLGAAAHAAILAGAKHGTADNIKIARANEVSDSVKDAARAVEAKYNTNATLIAAPAAAAAAVSNQIFARGTVLKNISVAGNIPPTINNVLNSIVDSVRDAVFTTDAPGVAPPPPPTSFIGLISREAARSAIVYAARTLRNRLNDPNSAQNALAKVAGAAAVGAALAAAFLKNIALPIDAAKRLRASQISDEGARWFIDHNGVITDADIRALPAVMLPAGLGENVIKALSQAARTAGVITSGAEAANNTRRQAKENFVRQATGHFPSGQAAYIGDRVALYHFYNGNADAGVRNAIIQARTDISRVLQAIHHIALSAQNFGIPLAGFPMGGMVPPFGLPQLIRDAIRGELLNYFNNAGDVGNVTQADIKRIVVQAENNVNRSLPPPPTTLPDGMKDQLSQNILNAISDPYLTLANNADLQTARGAIPDLPALFPQAETALLQSAQASFAQTSSQAIGAGIGSMSQDQALGNEITAELKAGHTTLDVVTTVAKKLPTDQDSIQSIAAAAFITQSDRRLAQPAAGDVIGAAYKIGQPSGMMTAATTLAAAAKNTALEVGLSPAVASDIAQRIVNRLVTGLPVDRPGLMVAINAALGAANPPMVISQADKSKIRENVLAAYAISCGQEAGKAAVIAHGQADQVKVRAVASISAAMGVYYDLDPSLAAKLGAGLAALYVQAAQAGQPLTDRAIRHFITTHPEISVGFPDNPIGNQTLNAISKATRAVSTIASENVTEATKAAAQAFPTNDNPRHSYNASIVAALCAGKKPVDIANSVAVAKAGVLASKASAEKVGSPAAAAASAADSLNRGLIEDLLAARDNAILACPGGRPAVALNEDVAAPVIRRRMENRPILMQALNAAAADIAQAILDVDHPGVLPVPQLVVNTQQAAQAAAIAVAISSASSLGATPVSISQAVSCAASIAAALVKAGCPVADAGPIAIKACSPNIMAKGIGAVLNVIRNEITSRNIVLPLPHQENVNNILKAASSGFGIGVGVIAGDILQTSIRAAHAGAEAIRMYILNGGGLANLAVGPMVAMPGAPVPPPLARQPIIAAIRQQIIAQLMPGGLGGGLPPAWLGDIINAAEFAANLALTATAGVPGATPVSVAEAVDVAVATAVAAKRAGLTIAQALQIAEAARNAGGNPEAISKAITDLASAAPISASPEQIAVITQAALNGLEVNKDVVRGVQLEDSIKIHVVSGSVKTTASALGVTDAKAEEVRQATKDSLSNHETSLEAASRGAGLLSGGNGLAVAAVGAFVADPGLNPGDKARQVSEASGVSQVRTSQRVLSTRPDHLDKNIQDRAAALEQYTADEEAATAEVMKKERAKLMKTMPNLPPLQTIKPSKTLDIEILDAKSALTWSITKTGGRSELLGSKFSSFKLAAKALSECVDTNGKSFLTRSALEAVIKDLKKNSFFDLPSDVTIIDRPPSGITIDFSTSSDLQINRLFTAWAKQCKTDYEATRVANPSPSPMRLGNPG